MKEFTIWLYAAMAMLILDDTTMLWRSVLVGTINAMIMHKFRWSSGFSDFRCIYVAFISVNTGPQSRRIVYIIQ